jgi:NIPSNAP
MSAGRAEGEARPLIGNAGRSPGQEHRETRAWSGTEGQASATLAAEGHLGVLVTMVGPLHRVYAYRAFADADHALRYEETRRADPAWRAFTERYRNEVTGSRTSLLRPAPVPRQRSLFEPAHAVAAINTSRVST